VGHVMNVGGDIKPFLQIFLGGFVDFPQKSMFRGWKVEAHIDARCGKV